MQSKAVVLRCFLGHAFKSSPMRFCTVRCACLKSQPNPPSRFKSCAGLSKSPGQSIQRQASSVLDTYGAETDLPNKLSSNNQIIHVSESNNGGM